MTQVVLSRYGQGSWILSRASLNSFTEYTIEPSQRDQHGFHSMRGEVSELGRVVAKRRARNFLLTGLGAIRNRACVSILPTAEIPENWRLLDEDDGN